MLSNVEFEKLYKRFTGMINSFIKKYRGLLEEDEIHQCCCIAIVKAHKTYNNHKDMKLSNWIYRNMEWQILRELSKENKHKNIISINSTVESCEGDTIELIDLIANDINIQEEIEDKLMIRAYEDEIIKYLDKKKSDIMILRYFHNYSYEAIEKALNITGISNHIRESRMELIRRSKLFRSEYKRIHGISDYNTERMALI